MNKAYRLSLTIAILLILVVAFAYMIQKTDAPTPASDYCDPALTGPG